MEMSVARAGRSALIAAGAGFGLLQSLRMIGNITQSIARIGTLDARIDTLHVAISRLAEQTEQVQAGLNQRVTRDELHTAIDRAFQQLESGIDDRFERQTRSVEALRQMVGQTDELLQRVLEGLDSLRSERTTEESSHWNLTQASR